MRISRRTFLYGFFLTMSSAIATSCSRVIREIFPKTQVFSLSSQSLVNEDLVCVEIDHKWGNAVFALTNQGKLYCWGDNGGDVHNIPVLVNEVGIKDFSSGYSHVVALLTNGEIICWGDNDLGQCNVPQLSSSVVSISAGYRYTCALLENGQVISWGSNEYNQQDIPIFSEKITQISAGYAHVTALSVSGRVYAWGGSKVVEEILEKVSQSNPQIASVYSGYFGSIAVTIDDELINWHPDKEYLGIRTSIRGVTDISFNRSAFAVLIDNNEVLYFDDDMQRRPVQDVVRIAVGGIDDYCFQLKKSGKIDLWHKNGVVSGTKNYLSNSMQNVPSPKFIKTRNGHYLAIDQQDIVHEWFENGGVYLKNHPKFKLNSVSLTEWGAVGVTDKGSLVQWSAVDSDVPLKLPQGDIRYREVVVDRFYLYTLSEGFSLDIIKFDNNELVTHNLSEKVKLFTVAYGSVCWYTESGKIFGIKTWENSTENLFKNLAIFENNPAILEEIAVPDGIGKVVQLCAGATHVLLLDENNNLFGVGGNKYGQSTIPSAVLNPLRIFATEFSSYALLSSGEIVCWGQNRQLPTAFLGKKDFVNLFVDDKSIIAVRSDGSVLYGYLNYYRDIPSDLRAY